MCIRDSLGAPQLEPTVIYEDNEGAIAMVKNPGAREKAKHIDIKVKYVNTQYEDGTIKPVSCRTDKMLADDFTKALPKATLERHIPHYMGEA